MKPYLIVIFLLVQVGHSSAREQNRDKGYLSLVSEHPMTVILNDTIEIYSPINRFPVAAGAYRLRAGITNDRNWYAKPVIMSFVVEPDDSLTLTLNATSYRLIQSFPSDALIVSDKDSVLGKTPLILNDALHPGIVYLEKPGFISIAVNTYDDYWPKTVVLKRDEKTAQTVHYPMLPHRQSFLKTHYKAGLAATAVVSNWLSFYMKRRADDYYRKYQCSSSLDRINYYYDRTERYDRYASILLGVSTAATTTYLYILIRK